MSWFKKSFDHFPYRSSQFLQYVVVSFPFHMIDQHYTASPTRRVLLEYRKLSNIWTLQQRFQKWLYPCSICPVGISRLSKLTQFPIWCQSFSKKINYATSLSIFVAGFSRNCNNQWFLGNVFREKKSCRVRFRVMM